MRLKMEIEMEDASLHFSLARRAPLLLAGGGGLIESPLGGTTAAPHLGTLHCIRVCLGVGGVVAIIIAEVLSQLILKSVKRALMVGLVGAFLT